MGRTSLVALCLGLIVATLVVASDSGADESVSGDSLSTPEASRTIHVVRWDDAITPVTRTYFDDVLETARRESAAAVVIELDTPGGLLDATRDIVSAFLDSPVPVFVWVGPGGARAASAGTFLTMAAHVASMAPGTNIGAASPISMGGSVSDSTLSHKLFNDTAAFVRTIAEKRGRNAEWAERAVREAESITETEALELGVIDWVAKDVEELVRLADGMVVELPAGDVTLDLAGAELERKPLSLRFRLLSLLANPNVAYIFLMLGIYGVFFELSNPGSIFPGVVGAIFLIVAFFSMQTLPMNYAGLMLILLGVVLFILEIKITSFGLLTIGGLVCSFLGALMLFDSPVPALRASLSVIIPLTLVTGAAFATGVALAVRTLRTPATTGSEGMIGLRGVARSELAPEGTIDVHGEIWRASATGTVSAGEPVIVTGIEGLLLRVRKGNEGE
jgi:membrane-bound serine protease (ClpP class)